MKFVSFLKILLFSEIVSVFLNFLNFLLIFETWSLHCWIEHIFFFFQRVSKQRSYSLPLRGWSFLNVVLLVLVLLAPSKPCTSKNSHLLTFLKVSTNCNIGNSDEKTQTFLWHGLHMVNLPYDARRRCFRHSVYVYFSV